MHCSQIFTRQWRGGERGGGAMYCQAFYKKRVQDMYANTTVFGSSPKKQKQITQLTEIATLVEKQEALQLRVEPESWVISHTLRKRDSL